MSQQQPEGRGQACSQIFLRSAAGKQNAREPAGTGAESAVPK